MATSKISATEGSGKNIATHSFSEDAVTKELQRVVLSDSNGADLSPATAANQTAQSTLTGAVDETAPSTDTASSGLNGRLQRIAQRITSLITLIPSALTGSGNFKVAVQEALPAGTNNIGDVDVLSLPADPLGANADAAATAGSTGSISAKLRLITSQLDSIKTAVETLDNTVAGNELQIDVVTSALPSGASTLTEQQSQTTHLSTIAGDTTDIEAAVELIDDAIVADDAAFTPSTTKVMMAGFTLDDSSTDTVNEGDAGAARIDASRRQLMRIVGATDANRMDVDASGHAQIDIAADSVGLATSSNQSTQTTALQLLDDVVFTDDAAFTPGTSKVSAVGYLADETASDSVDEGDIGAARMTLDRKQHVVAELESNSIRASGTAMTPKFAAIAASSSGNNTIVAAVNPRKIRVLAVQLVANGAVNAKWQSGAGGTDLTGLAYLAANGGYVLPFNPLGWFETASNTLLNLNLSGAVAVGGSIVYCEV